MPRMTPKEITTHAEKIRAAGITMTNYKTAFSNCLVLIRELSEHVAVLRAKLDLKDEEGKP